MSIALVVIIVLVMVVGPFVFSWTVLRRAGKATLHSCTPNDVPPNFGGAVAEFVQLGFLVAGAIRIENRGFPDVYVILFANPERHAYGRLWVTRPQDASYALITPLRLGKLATSTSTPTATDQSELQQVFPDASLEQLCADHERALTLLESRGVRFENVALEQADKEFREEWLRDVQAIRRARPKLIVDFMWRSLFRRPRYVGPLADQPGIDERVGRLATS